jgi:hypothetical protein
MELLSVYNLKNKNIHWEEIIVSSSNIKTGNYLTAWLNLYSFFLYICLYFTYLQKLFYFLFLYYFQVENVYKKVSITLLSIKFFKNKVFITL